MQNKKVTMLAAVLAVTVIAMAGVGYALSYSATTTNTGNYMDSTYVKLTQDEDGAYADNFLKDLYFNTVNETSNADANIKYTPVYTGTLTNGVYGENAANATGGNVAKISNKLYLDVVPSANTPAGKTGTLEVTVLEGTVFTPTPGLTYVMVITDTATSSTYVPVEVEYNTTAKHWEFTGVPMGAAHTYSVELFVKLADPTTPIAGNTSGFATEDSENKTTFKFTLSATDA